MVGNEDISGTGNEYKFSVLDDVCDVTHTGGDNEWIPSVQEPWPAPQGCDRA